MMQRIKDKKWYQFGVISSNADAVSQKGKEKLIKFRGN